EPLNLFIHPISRCHFPNRKKFPTSPMRHSANAGATAWGFLMVSTFVIWGSVQNLQFAVGHAVG
ncbi:MAG: hypothetical protein Q8J65_07980, partial [Nitrosomonadales bacterium]|nr:hypothetical protein [Nitrosomonadales bacterium]